MSVAPVKICRMQPLAASPVGAGFLISKAETVVFSVLKRLYYIHSCIALFMILTRARTGIMRAPHQKKPTSRDRAHKRSCCNYVPDSGVDQNASKMSISTRSKTWWKTLRLPAYKEDRARGPQKGCSRRGGVTIGTTITATEQKQPISENWGVLFLLTPCVNRGNRIV